MDNPAGQPSITMPTQSPWLSPKLVMRKTSPSELFNQLHLPAGFCKIVPETWISLVDALGPGDHHIAASGAEHGKRHGDTMVVKAVNSGSVRLAAGNRQFVIFFSG